MGEQRGGCVPGLAVLSRDGAQEQPTLEGDRDAERQHDRDRVHHETALLEEVEAGDEEIHVACPRWSSFANYGCRQLIIELRVLLAIPGRDDALIPQFCSRSDESRVGQACVSTCRYRW